MLLLAEWIQDYMTLPLQRSVRSFDDPIRPRQHTRRNREADLFGGFQIDHQLELGRLLDR